MDQEQYHEAYGNQYTESFPYSLIVNASKPATPFQPYPPFSQLSLLIVSHWTASISTDPSQPTCRNTTKPIKGPCSPPPVISNHYNSQSINKEDYNQNTQVLYLIIGDQSSFHKNVNTMSQQQQTMQMLQKLVNIKTKILPNIKPKLSKSWILHSTVSSHLHIQIL